MWIRIRAVIIEDEPLAAQYLAALLDDTCQVEVVGSATDSEAGLRLCAELRPDAVFLDINLPGKDGVSLARQLAMLPQPPRLVFTTGNANRATDAFRLEAVDYLLKPLDPEQVTEAVSRLLIYLRPFEVDSFPSSGDRAVTGLTPDQIRKAAAWVAEPKEGGKRRRTMFCYEKGLIWGNDNYRTNGALVNIALATGNIGRPGGGCVRMGGHQEGYVRPSDAFIGRPAPYVDQLLINNKGGVHHVWACDNFKTTLNAQEYRNAYKRRTDLVKYAMADVPYGDRERLVEAIMGAIRQGGLLAVDVDIIPTKTSECSHVVLPAATSGEMNLTSMNGERRMRITERYMDPPGQALPDCLIVARLAQALEKSWRAAGKNDIADKFKGYDWQTEEDTFMDGYHKHADGGEFVTYERLRAMGTNGFQEPATGFQDGKIIGTKRLYADGKFKSKDGKAKFMATEWRGLQAPGKQAEKDKFAYLINNGRSNHTWQSSYLDQQNEFIMDRWPFPFIQIHPDDMKELGVAEGDLVELYNDNGSTQAMVQPATAVRRKETFMLFANPRGVQGNVVSKGVNEFIIPNYKQTWANIRRISSAPKATNHLSFKSPEYSVG